MSKELFLCKDCKHSTMLMIDRIFTLNGLVGAQDVNYKCSKFPQNATVVENMVTGPQKVKAKLPYCEITCRHGECGQDAKYWQPKHKKDLFKMLTKETYYD
jgi:hypothetical protein